MNASTTQIPRINAIAIIVLASLLLQSCSLVGIRTTEEASYTVVLQDGPYEIRRYEPVMAVRTSVNADDFDDATDVTFNRLFDYITGANLKTQDIAMTAPVFSEKSDQTSGQNIAMTSPVLSQQNDTTSMWTLTFVLPATFTADNAPIPSDDTVELIQLPEKQVASLTFTGLWSQEEFDVKGQMLNEWLTEKGYTSIGPSTFAGYDPPWTLPFLRRNEVLIDVE